VVAEYFGRSLDAGMREAVAQWRRLGVAVIEDRTHAIFTERAAIATYTFGSLRKLLPLGDGCFVRGLEHPMLLPTPATDPSESSWLAMDMKACADPTDTDADMRRYHRAEQDFARALDPAPISSRSLRELARVDFPAMSAARRSNFDTLRSLCTELTVVNDDCGGGTPAYLVLSVMDPPAWQKELADEGVFCPIHWARPQQVPTSLPWRSDLISVPIDHRYGAGDMESVAAVLKGLAKRHA
jgi:hypothetical protein